MLAGGGAALAAGHSGAPGRRGGFRAVVSAVTSYLGLSAQQLRADLAAGQTLAQIATAQGKTASGLEQTIESAVKTQLDQAVTAGKISSQQEQTILSRLQARLDTIVTTAHPGFGHHGRWRGGLIRVSASYIGISPEQLRTELKAGKTLAQITAEHQAQGKTVAGLEQAITNAVKARLDKAVSANRITGQQETQILNRLTSRLDAIVNHSFGH
jgi:hypothetical protein